MALKFNDYLELEQYENEVYPLIQRNIESLKEKAKFKEDQCLIIHSDNVDKYVSCRNQLEGYLSQSQEKFDYNLLYWRKVTYKCFKQQKLNKSDFELCKQEANVILKEILDNLRI